MPQAVLSRSLSPAGAALPFWLWPAGGCLALVGLVSANPMLTSAGILAVPLLVNLLWRLGEPPILLACCLMQWLQVMVPVFHADLVGKSLGDISLFSTQDKATWLSLGGILAMAIGMRLALGHRLRSADPQIERELRELSLLRAFFGYLASFWLSSICGTAAWHLGGLAQLVLAIGVLKYAMLWILLCSIFVQGRGYRFMVVALALEVCVGFLGFFATYKEAFFVLGIAVLSVRGKLSTRIRLGLGCAVAGLLCLMLFWQAVKKEYRLFLNDGTGAQAVYMPMGERVERLGQLAMDLDATAIEIGFQTLASRVGYTELFAATLEWVPASEPFTAGELWGGAILHPFMPRLLFPSKEAIHDSERTRRFTGIPVSGVEKGTSIGIGFMAESYVDFGEMFMFLPILLLGYTFGWLYRAFAFSGSCRFWGLALAVAVLFATLQAFATTGSKLVGGVLTAGLVMFAINHAVGVNLSRWLRRGPSETGGCDLRRNR